MSTRANSHLATIGNTTPLLCIVTKVSLHTSLPLVLMAAPPGHPPGAIWRLRWASRPIDIPQGWSDAHLALIKKPENWQRPQPSQTYKINSVSSPSNTHWIHTLRISITQSSFSPAPGRSTADALRRVFEHCHEMPRRHLLEGMLRTGLPVKIVDVVMTWHQQAQYSINHDESTRKIAAT